MIREIGRVAWYRFRLDLPRRWTSYVGIVLLVALVGGLALGSIAGARRSESAYPTFLKGTNPSDLAIDVGLYNPKILKEIARLPQVTSIKTYVSPNAVPVTKSGFVDTHSPLFTSNFDPIASLNGLYFSQDRMTILQGTRPDPRRPDEAMVNEFAAKLYRWHVGSVVRFGFFSNAQLGQNGFPTTPSTRIVNVRITGIGVANTEVVQDEIDTIPSMILTPALDALAGGLLHQLRLERDLPCATARQGRPRGRVGLSPLATARVSVLLPCDLGHRERGTAGGQARVDRVGRLRPHRRPGHSPHRDSAHGTPDPPDHRGARGHVVRRGAALEHSHRLSARDRDLPAARNRRRRCRRASRSPRCLSSGRCSPSSRPRASPSIGLSSDSVPWLSWSSSAQSPPH